MSSFVRPLILSDDGKKHLPMPQGKLLEPDILPVSRDKANLLTNVADGLKLAAEDILSQTEKILAVTDGKLKSMLSVRMNSATNVLELLGTNNVVIGSVKLPVVPGLPTVAEIKKNFKPSTLENGELPLGTYMHLQFQMSDGSLKDIYYNVSDLVDVYVGGNGIAVTGNVIALKPEAGKGLEATANGAAVRTTDLLHDGEKVLGVADNGFYTQLSFAVDADTLILRGKNNAEVARIALPFSGEMLTTAEVLREFTPPPPHGGAAPALPESDYLHLHFDSPSGERDMYVDFGKLVSGGIWGKRVDVLPEGAALDELLSDMPIGAYVWDNSTDGLVIYLTPEEGDGRYVGLTGNQTVQGAKTFTVSPLGPTPPAADKSTKFATTAFVARALEEYDDLKFIWGKRVDSVPTGAALDALLADMPVGAYVWDNSLAGLTVYLTPEEAAAKYVALTGNQTVAGAKTFSTSPMVPTAPAGDKTLKAASTAFVDAAIRTAHANDTDFVRITGDQTVQGVKTFSTSPQVPTAPDGDNTTNAASTQFVTGAIAAAHASAPTLVRTAGNQTIDGVKTFLQAPVVPTQPAKDNSTKAASTAFVMQALSEFDDDTTWGKRVNTLPTGEALDALLADMPIGSYVWDNSTDGLSVYLTQTDADARYASLAGANTFTQSPLVPTPAKTDNSTRTASTAYVQSVFGDAVKTSGNQAIDGTKTFSVSPVLPTPAAGDNSTKAATTAFVQGALAALDIDEKNDVKLAGDQTIAGIKTFSASPVVPTLAAGDSSTKAASTAFVASAIAGTPWIKAVDGPLPEDVSAIIADMPIGAVVFSSDI